MKKLIITILVVIGFYTFTFAQPHDVGSNFGTLGIGVAQSFNKRAFLAGPSISPGLRATYEVGMWEMGPGTVTLGGLFGFSRYSYSYTTSYWTGFRTDLYTVKERHMNMIVAARSSYYYSFQDLADLYMLNAYAVFELGARFDLVGYNDVPNLLQVESNSIYPHVGMYLGANWHFTEQWAAFVEAGYGLAWTTVGVVYRFN